MVAERDRAKAVLLGDTAGRESERETERERERERKRERSLLTINR